MPIANCVVTAQSLQSVAANTDPVALWAQTSGQSADEMTINIVSSDLQYGREYSVMAQLLLPTAWSRESVSRLQLGLATALAEYFSLDASAVHVATRLIDSGYVVEGGRETFW